MDILIAIMWFLQILLPNQSYTEAEIEALAKENQAIIQQIQDDPALSQESVSYYDDTFETGNVGIIEEWEENPIPIKR